MHRLDWDSFGASGELTASHVGHSPSRPALPPVLALTLVGLRFLGSVQHVKGASLVLG
jgi:hypothetical protein